LSKAFSLQTFTDLSGYNIQQITGWKYGFEGGSRYSPYPGYYWLDASHLLLYPRLGEQVNGFSGQWEDLAYQPTIINLDNGDVWLPDTGQVYWSSEIGRLISTAVKTSSEGDQRQAIYTYTVDGQRIAYYWGTLTGVSPSRTKIVVDDTSIIDLLTGKSIKLAWNINYDYDYAPQIYWSADERRVYRCCYHFADLSAGESYSFEMNKLEGFGIEPPNYSNTHAYGQWVRNDNYFLVGWSVVDNGYPDFFPMFDPATKKYYEVSEMAGVPVDWTCIDTNVSSDKTYVWLECWEGSYLINLETFDSTAYPNYYIDDIEWSRNGSFAWIKVFNTDLWQILSVSTQELNPLSVGTILDTPLWWHPTDNALAYISEDTQKLKLVDAETMSTREIDLPASFQELTWSPTGKYLALLAGDGSLWQVDYPKLKNLQQLTKPTPEARDVFWSPDGTHIAFIGGSDIYIVKTMN